MKYLLSLVLLFVSIHAHSQIIIKEHLTSKIQDLKKTVITISDVEVDKIGKISLRINMKHNNWADLIVSLVAPNKEVFKLVNRTKRGEGKLRIQLTEKSAVLANIATVSARGDWQVVIEDRKKRNEGSVTYIYLKVQNFSQETPDRTSEPSPNYTDNSNRDEQIPPEAGDMSAAECSRKWQAYLANNDIAAKFDRMKFLCDGVLKRKLLNMMKAQHRTTGYRAARQYMFSKLDNISGEVCGVYTQECVRTKGIPTNSKMNCEHTWPKSKGAGSAPAKFDLHHLFPTKSDINSTRSSFPFCEVKQQSKGRGGSLLGKGRGNKTCFEPRNDHKGDVARGMLYFSIRYGMKIDKDQEFYFKKWNLQDSVNRHEKSRNIGIKQYQGNSNPFVEMPELVQFISNF